MSRRVYFIERALQGEYERLGRGTIEERDLRAVLYKIVSDHFRKSFCWKADPSFSHSEDISEEIWC